MSDCADLSDLSRIWADLRDLLEWQQGFGLYLIFTEDARVADLLLTEFSQWGQEHGLPIQVVRPLQSGDALQEVLAGLTPVPAPLEPPPRPLWIDLGDWSSDPDWPRVRQTILAALNQRRSWLEQEVRRPLFLHLPECMAAEVVTWAPDLWSIKRYLARLPAGVKAQPLQPLIDAALAAEDAHLPAVQVDWEHLAAGYDLPPHVKNSQALRDYALALAQEGADPATRLQDSLRLLRLLRALTGDTPQILGDLAASLLRLARHQQEAGEWNAARGHLHTALGLLQRRLHDEGRTVQNLQALAAVEKQLADLERANGQAALALSWLEMALAQQREMAQMQDESQEALAALQTTLDGLAKAQQEVGQFVLADEHRREAQQITKLLAAQEEVRANERLLREDQPETQLNLANSLDKFARLLAKYGKRQQALSVAKKAVQLHENLARQDVAAYGPILAGSLNNLANRLAENGGRAAALTAIQRAVDIYEDLARENFVAYGPVLALSLNNLSVGLAGNGERAAALAAIQRAVAIYEDLARENFVAYGPDLAGSLNNLSADLADNGERAAALEAIQRAVAIRENLAKQNFAAYGPALGLSLNNLANRFAENGEHAVALAAIQRAVAIREDLARQNFAAYGPDLAQSLHNWSICLADNGGRAAALAVIQRAVAIYEDLARQNFAAYGPDLALSLSNLSVDLSDNGEHAAALEAIQRAVAIREDLARQNFAAYGPDLAQSLHNWSICLARAGRHSEALAIIQRAIQMHQDFARQNPAVYAEQLAKSMAVLDMLSPPEASDDAQPS